MICCLAISWVGVGLGQTVTGQLASSPWPTLDLDLSSSSLASIVHQSCTTGPQSVAQDVRSKILRANIQESLSLLAFCLSET